MLDRFYRERAHAERIDSPKSGMLSFQQRFGGSLNAHCHIHMVAVDGVFALEPDSCKPRFHFLPPPTQDDICRISGIVAARVTRLLGRRGLLREPSCESNEPESINDALDGCRAVGHGRGRFERIDVRGSSQQELFPELDVRGSRRKASAWAAELDGYSVEAGVHFGALDRKGRERLLIVPQSEPAAGCSHPCPTKPKPQAPWSNDNTARKPIGDPSLISTPAPGQAAAPAQTASKPSWRASTSYVPWPELMRHCFDVDILDCPRCHGRLAAVAVIRRSRAAQRLRRRRRSGARGLSHRPRRDGARRGRDGASRCAAVCARIDARGGKALGPSPAMSQHHG